PALRGRGGRVEVAADAEQRLSAVRLLDDHRRRHARPLHGPRRRQGIREHGHRQREDQSEPPRARAVAAGALPALQRTPRLSDEVGALPRPAPGAEQMLTLEMPPDRFQFFTNSLDLKVNGIDVMALLSDTGAYTLQITSPTGATQTLTI